MTDPTAGSPSAASAPAGWYPDPAGSSNERYWAGSGWTAELRAPAGTSGPAPIEPAPRDASAPGVAAPGEAAPGVAAPGGSAPGVPASASPDYGVPRYEPYPATTPSAPAGTRTNTAWIWVIVLLPILSLLASSLVDWREYFEWSLSISTASSTTLDLPESAGAIALVSALGWVLYFVTVLLAFFDFRTLRSRGVVRPFHWAWAFLGSIVYVIGRSVVVRRRTGQGLTPLWVYIAIVAISFIVSLVQVGSGMSAVIDQLPSLTDPS